MRSPRLTLAALVTLASTLAVACGGGASPSPSSTTAAAAPSAAASAPASAAASEAAASEGAPSIGLPSFQLPSSDKELEALLPDQLCGATAQKLSMSGPAFATSADEQFKATLDKLGKSVNDVSFAMAVPTGGTCAAAAGIFKIKGADPGRLQQVYGEVAQQEGTKYEQRSVGGKNVYVSTEASGSSTYAYFAGDAIVFAFAKDDATAAPLLQELP
jgi:hypothetical protein